MHDAFLLAGSGVKAGYYGLVVTITPYLMSIPWVPPYEAGYDDWDQLFFGDPQVVCPTVPLHFEPRRPMPCPTAPRARGICREIQVKLR